MTVVEALLQEAIDRFNRKVEEDPELKRELTGMRKTVQLELEGSDWYYFVLEDARVGGYQKGRADAPDIRVISTAEVLRQLWTKELRPMKAIATRKLQIKGSIEDLLRFKKFF
ncbi:MAG: SCP2 sterol-binding domain-containing protein [Thermoplasmata archaeon]